MGQKKAAAARARLRNGLARATLDDGTTTPRPLPQTTERIVAAREHLYIPHRTYLTLIGAYVRVTGGPFVGTWGHVAKRTDGEPVKPDANGEHSEILVEFDHPVRGVHRAFIPTEYVLND